MKLKTKLIPLASVAAVCATVAPITFTSCGKNNANGFIDITKRYTPTIDYYKGRSEFVSNDDATKIYADHASLNPEIFVQDYLWSSSNEVNDIQGGILGDMPLLDDCVGDVPLLGGMDDLMGNLGGLDRNRLLTASNNELADAHNALAAAGDIVGAASADVQQQNPYTSIEFFGVSNFHDVKIQNVEIKLLSLGDFEYAMTLSFKINYQYEYKYLDDIITRAMDLIGNVTTMQDPNLMTTRVGEIEIKDFPYIVCYDVDNPNSKAWYVQPWERGALEGYGMYDIERTPWTISINEVASAILSTRSPSSPIFSDIVFDVTKNYNYTVSSKDNDFTPGSWKAEYARAVMQDLYCRSHFFYMIPYAGN